MHIVSSDDNLSTPHPTTAIEFLGVSPAAQRLLREARLAATGSDSPILITGPVGAGKSHLAHYVHKLSQRRRRELVFVDCGALTDLENELFGHRTGAFTGAARDHKGRLHQADGGILVLDDFERLSHHQQDLLHRVLVDGTYYPMGAERQARVDVRFIATTNKDVRTEVEAGRLKRDFVSRLDYHELRVSPLAERPDDIPVLCRHLLARHVADRIRRGLSEQTEVEFDEDCWPALKARHFEDNVRGLDKLVVRLLTWIGGHNRITPEDIEAVAPALPPLSQPWFDQPQPLRRVRDAAEREYILKVCRHASYNYRQVARILRISPKALYARLRQYGIERPGL